MSAPVHKIKHFCINELKNTEIMIPVDATNRKARRQTLHDDYCPINGQREQHRLRKKITQQEGTWFRIFSLLGMSVMDHTHYIDQLSVALVAEFPTKTYQTITIKELMTIGISKDCAHYCVCVFWLCHVLRKLGYTHIQAFHYARFLYEKIYQIKSEKVFMTMMFRSDLTRPHTLE